MATVNHLPALSNPALVSARSKKSISSACCPIFVCSGTKSTGSCPLDEAPNTPAALLSNCFFHSVICVGCSSNCWHSSAKVLSSRNATKATFALNSGLNKRRVRRPDDLLMMSSCPGTFAVAKTPNNALIRHVQFCRATSKAQGGSLWKNLRCHKQKRKRYASGRDRRGHIPNRRPLSERPLHVEDRKQIGHWECDTVIGANHKGAVVTMVERKSGYAVFAKVSNKTSELVSSAIVDNLKPLILRVKTLTYDNGKEFARHVHVDQELQSTGYFARPFASWERGSNENLNGLLGQYIPKKRAMSTVTDEEIRMIQYRLNNRPRKRLGFKTPAEVFHQSLKRVALRT